ncbi:MAG TPA: hypothetical protein PKE39_04450 [Ignavibacteria bacterium]|nr:hypothetical protein [Ignavibacteria bacterium]HMQ98253.1 hypothetical protein [Ignavibacteria bacterium]
MTLDANTERVIKEAEGLGIADEIKIRDLRIRCAFRSMRTNGMKYEDALYKCHLQFCLSEERIRSITKGITVKS